MCILTMLLLISIKLSIILYFYNFKKYLNLVRYLIHYFLVILIKLEIFVYLF